LLGVGVFWMRDLFSHYPSAIRAVAKQKESRSKITRLDVISSRGHNLFRRLVSVIGLLHRRPFLMIEWHHAGANEKEGEGDR
jgi:hypothetical protein